MRGLINLNMGEKNEESDPGKTFEFLTAILLTTYGTFWVTSRMRDTFLGRGPVTA